MGKHMATDNASAHDGTWQGMKRVGEVEERAGMHERVDAGGMTIVVMVENQGATIITVMAVQEWATQQSLFQHCQSVAVATAVSKLF